MSATNWASCPKCHQKAVADQKQAIDAAIDAYGKVPMQEHQEMLKAAHAPIELEYSLREDYRIGFALESTYFIVTYTCHCETCGFSHEFRHKNDSAY